MQGRSIRPKYKEQFIMGSIGNGDPMQVFPAQDTSLMGTAWVKQEEKADTNNNKKSNTHGKKEHEIKEKISKNGIISAKDLNSNTTLL